MVPSLLLLLAVPAPPQCPWEFTDIVPIEPQQTGDYPVNGVFFALEYTGDRAFELDAGTSSVTWTSTKTPNFQGSLVRVDPIGPLETGLQFALTADGNPVGRSFTVGTSTDAMAPLPPVLGNVGPNLDAYSVCPTAGVLVPINPVGEDLFYLAEDPAGNLLAVGGPTVPPFTAGVFIPTTPRSAVTFSIVAVDFAGQRSPPSMTITATAGATPRVGGSPRIGSPSTGNMGERGCDCATETPSSASALWGLLTLVPLVLRRRYSR